MALRFQNLGRLGIVVGLLLLGCSSEDKGNGGGAGAASGGMATAGSGTGGSASPSAGNGSGGMSAGASVGGNATGGASAGNASGGASGGDATNGGTANGGSRGGSGGATGGSGGTSGSSKTTFFVSSDTSMTGKLGGLEGADKRCQDLAMAAGIGGHTFHAYLSSSTVNAKDRIGTGPWVNAKGLTVAASVAALHTMTKGDHTLFIDEKGMDINGQWNSSAGDKNEHDILTGSMADGTVQAGKTCMDWTSDSAQMAAQVGHSDGMGPGMATTGTYTSWNSAHENESCANTTPRGGKGRIYCFAID